MPGRIHRPGDPCHRSVADRFHRVSVHKLQAGTTVTWTNKDDIPHGIAATNNAFKKSQALDTDDSYSFTFTTPGTYQYFCYLHPHMVGSIVVEAAG